MPLYEYSCKDCGQQFEKMMRFSEIDLRPECPNCQGRDTERMVSRIALVGVGAGTGVAATGSCGGSGHFT